MACAADAMSRNGDVMPFETSRMMPRPTATDVMRRNQNGHPTRRLTLPKGRPIEIVLSSKDVIHDFFLPNFRVKQDAVPGMTPEVIFFPTQTGHFELACAELCGLAHYRMRGTFNVVSQKEFEEWLRQQQ